MRITVIRHGKVDISMPQRCSSKEFDRAFYEYDRADICAIETEKRKAEGRVFVSPLSRSRDTAMSLFDCDDFTCLDEIREVPIRSFKDTEKKYRFRTWKIAGRLQWLLGCRRQPETRRDTVKRADRVIDICEEHEQGCILVTHRFFMLTLISRLKKRGYTVSGDSLRIKNLQEITAVR